MSRPMSTRSPRIAAAEGGRYARSVATKGATHPDTVAARQAFEYARARELVLAVVDKSPALDDAQRAQLAALILTADK